MIPNYFCYAISHIYYIDYISFMVNQIINTTMSTKVVRLGDRNSVGGTITSGHQNILVNGKPLARFGSSVTPHPCCGRSGCNIHCTATAAFPGSRTVKANGIPLLKVGNIDTCGHPRATGSQNTISR